MDGTSFHKIGSGLVVLMFNCLNYPEKIWKEQSILKILSKQNLVSNRQIQAQDF